MRKNERSANEAPTILNPQTERAAPSLEKVRRDSDAPSAAISTTDNENKEPNRAKPQRATAEPSRDKDRNESEEPKCKKSSTDMVAPSLANERNATDEPQ
jgi:hypothetical protein